MNILKIQNLWKNLRYLLMHIFFAQEKQTNTFLFSSNQ